MDSAPTVHDPLVGKWFIDANEKMIGQIESRIGPMYLVHRQDDPFDELCLVSLASMAGWRFGDATWWKQYVTEVAEVAKAVAVPASNAARPQHTEK